MNGKLWQRNIRKSYTLLIFLGGSLICCAVFSNWWIHLANKTAAFCTLNDEVYKTINQNLDYWLKYFPNQIPVLTFHTPSGDGYTIDASLWKFKSDSPILVVVVDTGWQEYYGNKGYWYSNPTKAFIDSRYEFTRLEGNIYCYHLKLPSK
jgi:hypothetical protein